MRGEGVYAVSVPWSSLTQSRNLSCVIVDFLVEMLASFISSMAPRH